MGIDKRIAGDVIGQLRALGGGGLGTFLGAQVAGNQNAVSGDFIAGLQQDLVAQHDVIHVDDGDDAVAIDFTLVFLRGIF